jgi:DNA modification methylase
MRWLCRLVTPPGGFILDPFAGSGTTGCAAALEGFHFAGVELDPVHTRLAMDRIAYWARSICLDKV